MGGFVIALTLTAAALIAMSAYFARPLSQDVATQNREALRQNALSSLERLTREQAHRYQQFFREAANRSRLLARQTEHQLAIHESLEPAFSLELYWQAQKGFHTNTSKPPISLLHWGGPAVSKAGRHDMRLLTHLGSSLQQAQQEVTAARAAWVITESRVVAYAPNHPLIEEVELDGETQILNSRFYTIATPDEAPEGGTQWTQAYQDPAGQGLMITAATPIYGPGGERFFGVAGIDLPLDRLANLILSQDPMDRHPGASGKDPSQSQVSFLMDGHARPVALSTQHQQLLGLPSPQKLQPGEVVDQNLLDSRHRDMRQATRQALEQDSLVVKNLTLAGTDYLAVFQTIPTTDWVLANLVARNAFLEPVHASSQTLNHQVTCMVGLLAATTLVLLLLMWSGLLVYFRCVVIRPLKRLTEAAERMRTGEYRVTVPTRGNDELAQLGRSFTEVSGRLADLIEDLETQVRKRTREAESARDHFRAILQSSPVAIAFLDDERRIQRVNPAFEALAGQFEEEVQGQDTRLFYPGQTDFERVGRDAYPIMKRGGIYRTITTLERPDGARMTISMKGQAVDPALEQGYIWVLQDVTAQRARERELQKYLAVFESSRDAVALMTEYGFLDCNPAALTLYEAPDRTTFVRYYTPVKLSPAYQPDGRPSEEAAQAHIQQAFEEGQAFFEWQHRSTNGRLFPAEILLSRVDLKEGPILQALIRDVSEKKAAFETLRQALGRAETYFESMRVMVLVMDTYGQVGAINQRGCELLGLPRETILGEDWAARFVPNDQAEQVTQLIEQLNHNQGELTEYLEHAVITATGEHRVIAFRNAVLHDETGQAEGILASGSDITEQRQLEAELQRQASHDPLTGAYNRRRMTELLHGEIERAQRYGTAFSLIMFDIDLFKRINDTYGHSIGDAVLQELTAMVERRLRENDLLARWGGEEFLALLPETPLDGAYRVAELLRYHAATTRFTGINNLTLSFGVTEFQNSETALELLKRVDNNLYAAKSGGRNRIV